MINSLITLSEGFDKLWNQTMTRPILYVYENLQQRGKSLCQNGNQMDQLITTSFLFKNQKKNKNLIE